MSEIILTGRKTQVKNPKTKQNRKSRLDCLVVGGTLNPIAHTELKTVTEVLTNELMPIRFGQV